MGNFRMRISDFLQHSNIYIYTSALFYAAKKYSKAVFAFLFYQ